MWSWRVRLGLEAFGTLNSVPGPQTHAGLISFLNPWSRWLCNLQQNDSPKEPFRTKHGNPAIPGALSRVPQSVLAASSVISVTSTPPRSISLEISKDTGSSASCFGERNWTLLCSSGFPEQKDWFSSPNYNQKYPIKIQTEAAHSCSSPHYHTKTSTADLRAFQAALPPSSAPPSVIPMPCRYRDSTQVSLPKVTFTKKLSRNDATNTGHKCPWHGFFNTSVIMVFFVIIIDYN